MTCAPLGIYFIYSDIDGLNEIYTEFELDNTEVPSGAFINFSW